MKLDKIKVKMELVKNEMTQEKLSEQCGISRVTIGRACNGSNCHNNTAQAIAKALNVPIESLM